MGDPPARSSFFQELKRRKVVRVAAVYGAGWLLEGGVQQAEERLGVDAQLIDARTDEHLWAETLDGDLALDDILSIHAMGD